MTRGRPDSAARAGRLVRAALALRRFLAEPLDGDAASTAVRERVATRAERFLAAAPMLLYGASSPYRPLLEHAGCSYADLEAGVRRDGLEETLERLRDGGVYVEREELKGTRPIVRGALELPVEPSMFDNPRRAAAVAGTTSGSRSQPLTVTYSFAGVTEEAAVERVFLETHGLVDLPTLLWLPAPPGTAGVHNVLLRAKLGRPPERWLSQVDPGRSGDALDRIALRVLAAQARLHGVRLPLPEHVELSRADEVAAWLAGGGRRVLRTFVGSAVRVALAAAEAGVEPKGAIALVGGEPLTAARRALLEEAAFRVVPRYSCGEAGLIGGGCGDGSAPDDCHLYLDRLAAIGGAGGTAGLLFTSLSPHARKVLLNVDLGDDAVVARRSCDCLLGEHGLDVHLTQIRSRWAETSEGMTVPLAQLAVAVTAVAEAAGLAADDVQVRPSSEMQPAAIVASPRVALDDRELVRRVLEQLAANGAEARLASDVWRDAGALEVVRAWPDASVGGKVAPVAPPRAS